MATHRVAGAGAESADEPRRARGGFPVLDRERDAQFTDVFDTVFTSEGVRILRTPVLRLERTDRRTMDRHLRRELFDRILILNLRHLEHAH
ncbi:MAG: hypothetical protein M3300_04610 [Actinomycetota bacterium]|nr:hypothetical protein [Actinomycetota bacterium]